MASYHLKIKPSARRELRKLPPPVIARLTTIIEGLKENPYPQGAKKMAGVQETWRIREGDYRIVYRILGNILTIEIIRIGHRREV
ncbi:type II toxin-antitoxin system RelE family toxin [Candidatus Contendibacter odensensis]|uniref:Addiction module toxin, RelE/StbE family subfamily n=1 Tax=Candidatus Contendobacter odensis Run_B_J11 TaxID=1400861 RepID=A0A7U7GCA0_9GAMM|nr:type II toxin-antitoxin system RelE/ParE family toxin [Candidatus Contendobacter odensis]CDH45685.1 Addiction module toxin, RelE/StbE family subfamily [Candidatus Contendobacter odensis Run_B_J11]